MQTTRAAPREIASMSPHPFAAGAGNHNHCRRRHVRLARHMLVGLADRHPPACIQTRLALVRPPLIAALCAASLGPDRSGPDPSRWIAWAQILAAAAFIAIRRGRSISHAFIVGLPVLRFTHAVGLS